MTFAPEIVAAVLHHMNGNHPDDNLLIARAFGPDEVAGASAATMTSLDESSGVWSTTVEGVEHTVRVPWPNGPISERPEIRREVVALYDAACAKLGVAPRPHE